MGLDGGRVRKRRRRTPQRVLNEGACQTYLQTKREGHVPSVGAAEARRRTRDCRTMLSAVRQCRRNISFIDCQDQVACEMCCRQRERVLSSRSLGPVRCEATNRLFVILTNHEVRSLSLRGPDKEFVDVDNSLLTTTHHHETDTARFRCPRTRGAFSCSVFLCWLDTRPGCPYCYSRCTVFRRKVRVISSTTPGRVPLQFVVFTFYWARCPALRSLGYQCYRTPGGRQKPFRYMGWACSPYHRRQLQRPHRE